MGTAGETREKHGFDPAQPGQPAYFFPDLEQSPFIVIWEITQACDLVCVHCRACAQPNRHPNELTTEEGFRLIEEIRRFSPGQDASQGPLFVITGGDPMKRPDVFDLVRHARAVGLRVAMSPSGTPLVTKDAVFRLRRLGLARLAISIDGPSAAVHDAFRGVPGSFAWTMNVVRYCQEAELPLQVNTTVTQHNLSHLERMKQLLLSMSGLEL
ncbi:MAG: radical SAM protein, partial [Armatimonadota bacterium]